MDFGAILTHYLIKECIGICSTCFHLIAVSLCQSVLFSISSAFFLKVGQILLYIEYQVDKGNIIKMDPI